MAATWFHDMGYLSNEKNPEVDSAMLAERFLAKTNMNPSRIEAVKSCILSTAIPQSPVSLIERITCDAQLFYLGTDHFFKSNQLLRKEWMLLNKQRISKPEWINDTVHFMAQHTYYTDYAQSELNDIKDKNLDGLSQKIKKNQQEAIFINEDQPVLKLIQKDKQQKNIKGIDKPEKGVETMFKITSGNHQRLSDMADKKAHIMITVNSIILSAIISLVLRKLELYGFLVIPTFILLLVSLAAMVSSILSTRPSVPRGTFQQTDLEQKKVNLLFFGNFYKMPMDQYVAGMEMMMEDGAFLYGSLIRDIYAQGVVLGKKYFLLRISYNIFMYGSILTVAAFMLAYLLN
jgi:hypothetical protein